MLSTPSFEITAVFYLFFTSAVVLLAAKPGLKAKSSWIAVDYGSVLAPAAYGTCDIANLSTLKNSLFRLSIVDMTWARFLTGVASGCGYLAAKRLPTSA